MAFFEDADTLRWVYHHRDPSGASPSSSGSAWPDEKAAMGRYVEARAGRRLLRFMTFTQPPPWD